MRRLAIALIGIAVAALLAWSLLAPPRRQPLAPPAGAAPAVRGAIHVHTRRSDGTGTVEQVAAAAARAGLSFVVFTDHGDASRAPEPPRYIDGVLCIDAVEISTSGGHVLALGIPQSPYPLGGEPRDVVEDIARLGGLSVAAHPGSPSPELPWLDWTVPVDGLEWLNADSEWRDEPPSSLARTLLTYFGRRPETLAALFDRPEPVLSRWDALGARRAVIAVAGADAHARLWGSPDEGREGLMPAIRLPSYESMFRAMSNTLADVALSGRAAEDAAAVLQAIASGRVFSSIDGLAGPASLAFAATAGGASAGMGETLAGGVPATFDIATNAPPEARVVLIRDGQPLATGAGRTLRHTTSGERGVFRAEVYLDSTVGQPPVPWIVSNPIYVRLPDESGAAPEPYSVAEDVAFVYENGPAPEIRIESSSRSDGAADVVQAVGGTQLSFRYALGGARSDSPYAALVLPTGPGVSGYGRLIFTARASAPMRVSVQVRAPDRDAGERWHRSVYLDRSAREVVVPFEQMTPRGATTRPRPPLEAVTDLLFVVDTVNTAPGSRGQIWLDDIRYAR